MRFELAARCRHLFAVQQYLERIGRASMGGERAAGRSTAHDQAREAGVERWRIASNRSAFKPGPLQRPLELLLFSGCMYLHSAGISDVIRIGKLTFIIRKSICMVV